MPATAGDTASCFSAQAARRWQAIDPLLPAPASQPPGCGTEFVVAGPGREPAATGTCEHLAGTPGSLDLTWGAARRYELTVRLAGPDAATALGQLLARWHDHLASLPGAGGADTAALVPMPSRDVDVAATLLRHGFAPLSVIAARSSRHHPAVPAGGAAQHAGIMIRRARPADVDAVVRLGLEVIRFDAHFGSVTERPETAAALRHEAAGLLAGPAPWTWLAERAGTPIGMLCAEPPAAASWIAPMVAAEPVAYLFLMGVLPAERGTGVGAAMAERFNRETEAAGVPVTLLHYAQLNPLSVPFWSQQGYRPVWTSWEKRPAFPAQG